MYIKGFIHVNEEEAFFGSVSIVRDIAFYAGEIVGYMYLTNGEIVEVKRHPCGNYNGSFIKDKDVVSIELI